MQKFYFSKEKNKVVYGDLEGYSDLVLLEANSVEASFEKHIPVIEKNGCEVKVSVGEVTHPMLDVHYIMMIALETNMNLYFINLEPGQKPEHSFTLLDGEEVIHAYEYCNLHGLWVK